MKTYTFLAALFFTACTPAADDTSEVTKSEPTAEPASSPSSSTTEPSSESNCTDAASFDLCAQCLAEENPMGAQAYSLAVLENCYCANDCAESCTDFCADETGQTAPAAECETCVSGVAADQNSSCIQGFSADCSADAGCVDFATQLQSCPSPQ